MPRNQRYILILVVLALGSVTALHYLLLRAGTGTSQDRVGLTDQKVVQQDPSILSINLVIVPFLGYNASAERILQREKEYRIVLQRNLNHDLISRVHILTTNVQETLKRFSGMHNQSKLVVAKVKSTDLARDPWDYISKNLVGQDVMFSNADIYLGRGFEKIDPLVMFRRNIMYSLTRRTAENERCPDPYGGVDMCVDMEYIESHDVFLFRLHEPLQEDFLQELEFDLVCLGMESVVIWLFQNKLNYCVLNPCSILETFHFHCSGLRNKKGKPRVNTHIIGRAEFTTDLVC